MNNDKLHSDSFPYIAGLYLVPPLFKWIPAACWLSQAHLKPHTHTHAGTPPPSLSLCLWWLLQPKLFSSAQQVQEMAYRDADWKYEGLLSNLLLSPLWMCGDVCVALCVCAWTNQGIMWKEIQRPFFPHPNSQVFMYVCERVLKRDESAWRTNDLGWAAKWPLRALPPREASVITHLSWAASSLHENKIIKKKDSCFYHCYVSTLIELQLALWAERISWPVKPRDLLSVISKVVSATPRHRGALSTNVWECVAASLQRCTACVSWVKCVFEGLTFPDRFWTSSRSCELDKENSKKK